MREVLVVVAPLHNNRGKSVWFTVVAVVAALVYVGTWASSGHAVSSSTNPDDHVAAQYSKVKYCDRDLGPVESCTSPPNWEKDRMAASKIVPPFQIDTLAVRTRRGRVVQWCVGYSYVECGFDPGYLKTLCYHEANAEIHVKCWEWRR